jgi:hypothetical protein
VIKATLERMGASLRLSLLLQQDSRSHVDELARTTMVQDVREAEGELSAFKGKYPGNTVQRLGGGWSESET